MTSFPSFELLAISLGNLDRFLLALMLVDTYHILGTTFTAPIALKEIINFLPVHLILFFFSLPVHYST